ncbi:glutamate synthase large subunit, partial [Nitrospinota bacterium]
DPAFEHDACGVAFVADLHGRKSQQIIKQAITALNNLSHRGASGSEVNTGDGAGILVQMPHKFLAKVYRNNGGKATPLPEPGRYGAGMVFLPPDPVQANEVEMLFESIIREEGCQPLGWRDVPTDLSSLGPTALSKVPRFRQIFIGGFEEDAEKMQVERKLYVIRKRIEHTVQKSGMTDRLYFHIPSLSSQTLIYKGMLTPGQLELVFPDLMDPDMESGLALVHSRFSTNTFPSWPLAHPYRYMSHNGEINTLRSNINWMHAREALCETELLPDLKKILPIVIEGGSDSATFDNVLEFLFMAGRELPHAVLMMIPEPWAGHESMSEDRKAFYEFHGCLMEPWDGPASIAFTDGTVIGAVLDRNGLRPSRYYVTKDDLVVMASEVGVLDIPPENILIKERLHPGRIFLVDTSEGRIIDDEELKRRHTMANPYQDWLKKHLVHLDDLPEAPHLPEPDHETVLHRQQAFGYTFEDLRFFIGPMVQLKNDPVGSMGNDAALAVLSDRPRLLYDYFKQLFAQVTNPPLDAIREEIVTQISTTVGPERNLLKPEPKSCRQIKLDSPILSNEDFYKLVHLNRPGLKTTTLSMLFRAEEGVEGLKRAMDELCHKASNAIKQGYSLIVLSDRGVSGEFAPIPALFATAGVHHHLVREGTRTRAGLLVETGEARQVHHMSLLLGYGAGAINPYLAFETIDDMTRNNLLEDIDHETAVHNYIAALNKGIIKVISKMGISTIQSYRGAQIFEAIGLNKEFVDRYFTWTPSRIGGIGIEVVTDEVLLRHRKAYPERQAGTEELESGGYIQWRRGGEHHLFNPETVFKLQHSTRTGQYKIFKEYSELVDNQSKHLATLRGLLDFKWAKEAVPLDEVEPAESIMKRFSTGAMSYGSISQEAHETLAIAMNRIGGKSNTGEGGEDPARYVPDENGDLRRSAIKQVASGRFGVTSEYLVNADDLQIKMAQGAKPGEGGQLPGGKVFPWIAKVRYSTPAVGLISPPPHHDIYSIEDLAQLIYDLKNSNPQARIHVKLVSEIGVGTVAAGVSKAHSDVVLISGHDGGTGASPITSIKHAGTPWELGLAETQQVLVMNRLRDRISVQVDGQLKTGRDVMIGAMLGADEFGFATAPLVVVGCVMMRVCHLNTCPVGIATQDPELRKKFSGKPEFVENFFRFVAEEVREYMSRLGFRTMDEMIGRVDKLNVREAVDHWKARGLDFSPILHNPDMGPDVAIRNVCGQDHGLEKTLDVTTLIPKCKDALERKTPVKLEFPIQNINRTVGTILGYELTKRHGGEGLPEDTIQVHFKGSAGQSFGAFVPSGITLTLEGDTNDYVGKGLSGGKLIVFPPRESTFEAEKNILIGNVALYGATGGEAYFRGIGGERFAVRNSGALAVVESVGDHGCEYMTGGRVVVLGRTGRNFAAGMSGGIAYVLDEENSFRQRCNMEMVDLENLVAPDDVEEVKDLIRNHVKFTGSTVGERILGEWDLYQPRFVKVMPRDYKRAMTAIRTAKEQGIPWEKAVMEGAHG